ncbi:MAG: hypothetical protein E7409_07485 [Ruminococcaceae bacterium]|nr:hypothetical protein [Oscillospiraceae bacterium]
MTNIFKEGSKVFGMHLAFMMIALVFMPTFGFLLDGNIGRKVYALITGFLALSAAYSVAWKAGRKDERYAISQNKHIPAGEQALSCNRRKGLWIGLIGSIPTIAALVVYIYAWQGGTDTEFYAYVNMAYRIYHSAFLGFLGDDNLTYIWNCVIVTCIVPLLCTAAYVAGIKQFSVSEWLMPRVLYKKKKDQSAKG